MDIKDILTIMDRFDQGNMTKLQLKIDETELNIEKDSIFAPPMANQSLPSTLVASGTPAPAEHKKPQEDGFVIKSPLVGIYYESSSPDSPLSKNRAIRSKLGK
ncbi:hypothetical protein J0B03_08275 [Alkalibacter rhizosphaerae]|uniref:Uncharacterized protein n=1 Tax=Alkalibacter rhizosphaerae TaxID=2815577 RepID=A0A975AHA6_9FIRM|nr:hypothetical protein [Alkalibacter rhizosphaerae]QSX07808.1 hypothetical protein J0B03_08275 [Alkalibacter rhizosphaerae]